VRLRDRFGADGQLERVAWLERVGRGKAVPKKTTASWPCCEPGLRRLLR